MTFETLEIGLWYSLLKYIFYENFKLTISKTNFIFFVEIATLQMLFPAKSKVKPISKN